jgi:hypothetical protein
MHARPLSVTPQYVSLRDCGSKSPRRVTHDHKHQDQDNHDEHDTNHEGRSVSCNPWVLLRRISDMVNRIDSGSRNSGACVHAAAVYSDV